MKKIEYKVEKNKDFTGKRYESYTVEKIITHDNGKVEHLHRVLFPHIDGKIDEINLEDIYFQNPITQDEWEKLSPEYHKAWLNGIMTEELSNELENLRLQEDILRIYKQEEIDTMNYILGKQKNNNYFTEFELKAMAQIDLSDRKVVDICKIIWDNKDDEEKLKSFKKQLDESICKN
jgi:hypothetical protein